MLNPPDQPHLPHYNSLSLILPFSFAELVKSELVNVKSSIGQTVVDLCVLRQTDQNNSNEAL